MYYKDFKLHTWDAPPESRDGAMAAAESMHMFYEQDVAEAAGFLQEFNQCINDIYFSQGGCN